MFVLGTMHLKSLAEPGFVRETLANVTVPEGRDVVLSCTVKNLDGHKVIIIDKITLIIISFECSSKRFHKIIYMADIIIFFI